MVNPSILTHPNIPKPLHGFNPRTILGKEWWDIARKKNDNGFCNACGIAKKDTPEKWLEGHEFYKINYFNGEVRFDHVVNICHKCHNFIHSGRLYMLHNEGKIPLSKVLNILNHGFKILEANKLQCFSGTYEVARYYNVNTLNVKPYKTYGNPNLKWNDWHLLLFGKKYYSKFKSYEEWEKFYQG